MKLVVLLLLALASGLAQTPICDRKFTGSTTSSGATGLITVGSPAQAIRICSVDIQVTQGGSPANFGLVTGTGATCGTGQSDLTPQWEGYPDSMQGFSKDVPTNAAWITPGGDNLCLKLSAAATAKVFILYALR